MSVSIPSQEQFELLTDYDIGSAYSEAYRTIYANICFNLDKAQEKPHTLLLTMIASSPRVVLAANVAIIAAQSGTPTILIDADLRKPDLEQRFGLEKGAGLRDLLQADVITPQQFRQCLRKTFVNNLLLLSAGSDDASEEALFSSRLPGVIASMRDYLAETAEGKTGMIIFHSSPVLAGPDASLIGAQVEQTILAIVKGRTTRSQAKQAQEQLQRAHVNLAGIIILDK
jgi:Mrp family chromosome partitioning ATPase